MRCPHEILIAALDPTPLGTSAPDPAEGVTTSQAEVAVCSVCKECFAKDTGGKCRDCKDQVLYCSKKCQVIPFGLNCPYVPLQVSSIFGIILNQEVIVYFLIFWHWHFQEEDWEQHRLDCGLSQKYLNNTAEYLLKNSKIPDTSVLKFVSGYDAAETLQLPGKWPRTFACVEDKCPKCDSLLTTLTNKKQKNKSDKKLLITKLHVIVVDILSKKCKKCYLIISPETLKHGLLNIGNICLVSLDMFFSLRNTIRLDIIMFILAGIESALGGPLTGPSGIFLVHGTNWKLKTHNSQKLKKMEK